MAKISTYPVASPPSLSSMLIGTDMEDNSATKNFTIGEVLALLDTSNFVPYEDPTTDVDLTPYGLRTQYINTITELSFDGNPGEPGQIAMSNGGEAPPQWVNPQDALPFVPYTGATDDVDLGTYSLFTSRLYLESSLSEPINGGGTSGQILTSQGDGVPPLWVSPATVLDTYKGSFYDSLTQTLTGGAGVAIPVILRQTDAPATNGVSVVTDGTNLTRITVANAGVYNLLFSAQLGNLGGTSQTVDFWLRKNGATAAFNVPDSNGKVQLQSNNSYVMAAWNYFIALNAGDYIYLMWTATSTNVTMITEAANGVHPATPSIIVTLNKV